MRVDDLSVAVRPREPYEAIDLGVRLMQSQGWAVARVWLMWVVPIMVLLALTHFIASWLPMLLIWWAKPLYDRFVLLVLSRAVFGQTTTASDVWQHRSVIFGRGLWRYLLWWRRFDLGRSFSQPLYMLEGLKGRVLSDRMKVVRRNGGGHAILTNVAYAHVEFALAASFIAFIMLMTPNNVSEHLSWSLFGGNTSDVYSFIKYTIYVMALSVVEPFYVASGFCLYLNRRVELEAWDIELEFRRAFAEAHT